MHNRARLITASYLTRTLNIDWREGARHFWELLVDGDVASNAGNVAPDPSYGDGMSQFVQVDPNQHDRFVLRQKFRFVVNEYEFSLPIPGSEAPGQPFTFVRQKPYKFKEDIRFYADESKSAELMHIKARQRFDPSAKYDVVAADGTTVGYIQKVFGKSLLRSTYTLYGADGNEVATVTEQNLAVALIRRLIGFIPYIGGFADWLPIPYNFVFLRDGVEVGTHRRQLWKLMDVYTIEMTGDPERVIDRRLLLAIAVGMDALQAR